MAVNVKELVEREVKVNLGQILDAIPELDPGTLFTVDDDSEIYEYWAVSESLAIQLERDGEPVAQAWGLHIWGRTTTGQAIRLDGCIKRIAERVSWY